MNHISFATRKVVSTTCKKTMTKGKTELSPKRVRIYVKGITVNVYICSLLLCKIRKKLYFSEGDLTEKAETLILEEGTHTYYFECKLPPELPSSFEGQYGQIRYLAKAYLDRPSDVVSKKSSIVTKKAFTVLSGLDLNFIPEAAVSFKIVF